MLGLSEDVYWYYTTPDWLVRMIKQSQEIDLEKAIMAEVAHRTEDLSTLRNRGKAKALEGLQAEALWDSM